jgi:hypothetical protein
MSRWTFVLVRRSFFIFLYFYPAYLFTDRGDKFPAPPCSVRIPYSLVSGLDISSRAYHKAISTIAKQKNHDRHDLVTCSKAVDTSLSVPMDIGMCFITPFFIHY